MPTPRVLLVDDSPGFLESAAHFLSAETWLQVVGSGLSGRDALEQADVLRPDLVLMDWAMPEMDGLEATRHLKARTDAPRVILITLHASPEYKAAAEEAGADGFLAKAEFGTGLLPLIRGLFPASAD